MNSGGPSDRFDMAGLMFEFCVNQKMMRKRLRANNLSLTARYEIQVAPGYLSQTGSLRLRQLF